MKSHLGDPGAIVPTANTSAGHWWHQEGH